MSAKNGSVQGELVRRHKMAATVVGGLSVMTLVLVAVAYLTTHLFSRNNATLENPTLDMVWRIGVPILGFGALALRRTRFSAMRLQDIAALRGINGLLVTLQRTTIEVALLGGTIALIGFVVTIMTGIFFYTLGAGIIALAVLLYSYPRRAAWQRVVDGIEEAGDADASSPAKGRVA